MPRGRMGPDRERKNRTILKAGQRVGGGEKARKKSGGRGRLQDSSCDKRRCAKGYGDKEKKSRGGGFSASVKR